MNPTPNSSGDPLSNQENLTSEVKELLRSSERIRQLVYSMEHDRTLDAQAEKIVSLKTLLHCIEERIGASVNVNRGVESYVRKRVLRKSLP